jgi:hypothetical protein
MLSASAVVLQAMWCAQTVPECGSFDSVVAGAILPAMQKVRWRRQFTVADTRLASCSFSQGSYSGLQVVPCNQQGTDRAA